MTLIEDARKLAAAKITREGTVWCHFCGRMIEAPDSYDPPIPFADQHASDCPWLAMPKIVAALDAAEELLEHTVGWSLRCVFCHECLEHGEHGEYCPWQALVAAMKGDGA